MRITDRWKSDLDPFEAAKSYWFDTSNWRSFCDVTLTLKQARQSENGAWIKIDDYPCRQAFRHFMNLLNRAVYGAAFRRHGKRLRVLPVLEKGEVRARALRSWERGTSGRWHVHCAIELPSHLRAVALEKLIRACWAKVELGYGRILVRDRANAGWIDYMLKTAKSRSSTAFLTASSWSPCTIQLPTRRRSIGTGLFCCKAWATAIDQQSPCFPPIAAACSRARKGSDFPSARCRIWPALNR